MPLVKLKTKSQVTIPDAIRQQLSMKVGDLLEAKVQRGSIILKPKTVVDRDEYTPTQRRRINEQLGKSIAEYKEGKYYGPFNTVDEMIASMKAELKKRGAANKRKRST